MDHPSRPQYSSNNVEWHTCIKENIKLTLGIEVTN